MSNNINDRLKMQDFNFTIPYVVRIADINYGGHVANSAVLNFFQDARIAYLLGLGNYSEMDIGAGCGIILPEAHVYYRAEMYLGDELTIGVKTTHLSRSSFTLEYRIERAHKLTAEGQTVLVCYDYDKRKPRRLNQEFRNSIERFENSALI